LYLAHGIGSNSKTEAPNTPWGSNRIAHTADGSIYNTIRMPFGHSSEGDVMCVCVCVCNCWLTFSCSSDYCHAPDGWRLLVHCPRRTELPANPRRSAAAVRSTTQTAPNRQCSDTAVGFRDTGQHKQHRQWSAVPCDNQEHQQGL